MTWVCGLCMVSPSADGFEGTRDEVAAHLREHGIPEDRFETYRVQQTGEQATLSLEADLE